MTGGSARLLAVVGLVLGLVACADEAPAPQAQASAQTQRDPDLLPGYSFNAAMELSGQFVPGELQEYYLVEIAGERSNQEFAQELAGLMARARDERDFLGVVGEDAGRSRAIILDALTRISGTSLAGATIIYVGRSSDEAELRLAVEATGAEFHFADYTGSVPQAVIAPRPS